MLVSFDVSQPTDNMPSYSARHVLFSNRNRDVMSTFDMSAAILTHGSRHFHHNLIMELYK